MQPRSYLRLKNSVRIKKYTGFCVAMDVVSGNQKYISPLMGFILALCDGTKRTEDIIYILSKLLNKEAGQIEEGIDKKINDLLPFIDMSGDEFRQPTRYKPENFIFNYNNYSYDSARGKALLPLKTPTVMTIALTNRCNFECIYCFKSSGRGYKCTDELGTEEWIDVIRQAKELDILKCNVTGGEPILHPGFFEIIERLTEADIFPYISTNGSLITRAYASRLSGLGIGIMQISLDAPCADIHHKMSRSADTFDKVIDGIRYLREANVIVRVKSVITPLNYKETGRLIDLCASLGVSSITLDKFNPGYGGRGANELILDSQMAEYTGKCIEQKTAQYNDSILIYSGLKSLSWKDESDITACGGLYSAFAIQPNGNMAVCEQLDLDELTLGNVREQPIAEMWGSDKAINILNPDPSRFIEPCRSCEYLGKCRTGCFSHTLLYDKNLYAPDPSCWKIHLDKNPLNPIQI
ncbi:MAG: radical SAM protein [Bacillota bacterium]|nr:radical SAM protein [Bacillota bacterium]